MVNFLLRLFPDRNKVAISRGYGRKTKGFYPVTATSTANEVGDEPLMLSYKNPDTQFFVSEKRVAGYQKAVELLPNTNLFVFDDVFQHRHIKTTLNILLCDYHRPFYTDYVLPMGRLRESRKGAKRADVVIVTKCPLKLKNSQNNLILKKIGTYTKAKVFFASYLPNTPKNCKGETLMVDQPVILLSALANNYIFYQEQSQTYTILNHFAYKDHHAFTPDDVKEILTKYPQTNVITTEKDYVKLKPLFTDEELKYIFVTEIDVKMHDDESFREYIRSKIV